jgi:transposase
MQGRGRRTFSEEFRREAVRLAHEGTTPLRQLARELGIDVTTLRGWRRRATAMPDGTAPGTGVGSVPALEAENRRLRRENARLLEEREILKKATAFFAKGTR